MTTPLHHRIRAGAAGAAAAALLLTACGAQDEGSDSDETSTEATEHLPAGEGKAEYPMTLQTPWGETTLEQRPERIATVTPSGDDVEMLAALGVSPVAAPDTADRSTYLADHQPVPVEESYEPSRDGTIPIETIAASEPDLIVAVGDIGDDYDQLSEIAPVLVLSPDVDPNEATDWQSNIGELGAALDLEDAAGQVVTDHDQFFEDFREEHPVAEGSTATYAVNYGDEYGMAYFSTPGSDVEDFLVDLGFTPNPRAEEFSDDDSVSEERIGDLDADVLVVSDNTNGELEKLTDQPLFQQLGAVQDDNLVIITNHTEDATFQIDGGEEIEGNVSWALARSGPLGTQWAAEEIGPAMTQKAAE